MACALCASASRCCSQPVHSTESADVLDMFLLGSGQGQLSHQLLLRYQLQLFILMENVFKHM